MKKYCWGTPKSSEIKIPKSLLIKTSEEGDIEPSIWAKLGKSTKGLLITLLSCMGEDEKSCVSQIELAAKTGCSISQVVKSLDELEKAELILFPKQVVSSSGQRSYRYSLPFPRSNEVFFVDSMIVEGGAWSLLSPVSQALYPIVFAFSFEDHGEVKYLNGMLSVTEGLSLIGSHLICKADVGVLHEFSGIGKRSYPKACDELVAVGMIQPIDGMDGAWGVVKKSKAVAEPCGLNVISSSSKSRKAYLQKIISSQK